MPLVTVVVPAYNVEKYINRCIDSILNQTLKEIEVVIVDDGSPDLSGQIADEYAVNNNRVKVIHKENGGLSSARNAGMRIASGKYISFVDTDDWLEPETLEKLFEVAEQFTTDVVLFDYTRKTPNGDHRHTEQIDPGYYNRTKIISDIFPDLIMGGNIDYGPVLSAWSCFYRNSFLRQNKLEFDENVFFSEDSLFSSMVMEKADSFFYLQKSFYNYFYNANSISTVYKQGKWENTKLLNNKISDYFGPITSFDFKAQIKRHMVYFACNSLSQVCNCDLTLREKHSEIRRILLDKQLSNAMNGLSYLDISKKFRVMIWIMKNRLNLLYILTFNKRW